MRCFSSPRLPSLRNGIPSGYRVAPFGDHRINSYLQIPGAFRSLSRPSSPLRAKASSVRPSLLSFQHTILVSFILVCQYVNDRFSLFQALRISARGFWVLLLPLTEKCRLTWGFSSLCDQVGLSRKEVFQPHLPVRLPCYDLAPVTSFTLGRSLRLQTSGTPGSHGLTGGVYKARERIHRAMADARLLANPASWSRVADSNPN